MIGNYLKIAVRNIKKNKAYTFINVFGLGLSIFLFASVTAVVLAFLSVVFQGILSAGQSPVNNLRNE